MSSQNKSIGGYFELELPPSSDDYHQGALKYQSARSAFLSLLRSLPQVQRVWMPYYICDSMLSPVQASGKEILYYSLDEQLKPSGQIELASTDILLYVNYFGVCSQHVQYILRRLDPAQVVIDCSQAFYSAPIDCLATIYSPRKFFGIPDGGLLVTSHPVILPEFQANGSESRMHHLIHRLTLPAESGYESYKQAESSLQEIEPKRMSALTERLLGTIDYNTIKRQRQDNFRHLHEHLSATNQLSFETTDAAPLSYPYMPTKSVNKYLLLKNRIYTPTYWPDVLHRVHPNSMEAVFTKNLISIPCDQRYSKSDLNKVITLLK